MSKRLLPQYMLLLSKESIMRKDLKKLGELNIVKKKLKLLTTTETSILVIQMKHHAAVLVS